MNSPDTLRDALLGALGLQTGLVTEPQLLVAWEESRRHPATPLLTALLRHARLSLGDRSTLEYLVERSLAQHAGDAQESLRNLALTPTRRALLNKLEGVAAGLVIPPAPEAPRGRGWWALAGAGLGVGVIIILAALLVWAAHDASQARSERDASLVELRGERVRCEAASQDLLALRAEADRATSEARQAAEEARRDAREKAEEGERRARAAAGNAQRAEVNARQAEDFAERLVRCLAEPPLEQPDAQRRVLLEQALQYYQGRRREAPHDRTERRETATACLRMVPLHLALTQDEAADRAAQRALELFAELGREAQPDADLPLAQARARSALAAVLQHRNRPHDAAAQLQTARRLLAAVVKEDDGNLRAQEQLADTLEQLADACQQAGQPDNALAALKEAEPMRTRLAVRRREQPEHRERLASLFLRCARLQEALRQSPEALRTYQQALPLCQKLAADYPQSARHQDALATVCMALGDLLRAGGQPRDAREHYAQAAAALGRVPTPSPGQRYRRALCHLRASSLLADDRQQQAEAAGELELARTALRALVGEFPNRPGYREELTDLLIGLGNVYHSARRLEEAEKAFQEGLGLCEPAPAGTASLTQRHRHGTLHYNLGNLSRDLGRRESAEKHYRAALALRRQLVDERPRDRQARWEVSMAAINLGNLLQDAARYPDAEKLFLECIDRLGQLADEFPKEPEFRRCQAMTQCNMGNLLSLTRDPRRAEQFYTDALKSQEALSALAPRNPVLWADLANTNLGLGNIYQSSARLKEAEKAFDTAIRYSEALAREDNAPPEHARRLGVLHFNRGNLLQLSARHREAKEAYQKALARQTELWNRYPEAAPVKHDLAETCNNLAMLLADCPDEKLRDAKEALTQARKATELEPTGNSWNTVGLCCYRLGKWQESREALEKAMKLREGGDAFDWYFLAMALWQLGEKDAARDWLARAERWRKEKAPQNDELRRYRAEANKVIDR
jgi:tetratricopeptide (TPR) repeat protein